MVERDVGRRHRSLNLETFGYRVGGIGAESDPGLDRQGHPGMNHGVIDQYIERHVVSRQGPCIHCHRYRQCGVAVRLAGRADTLHGACAEIVVQYNHPVGTLPEVSDEYREVHFRHILGDMEPVVGNRRCSGTYVYRRLDKIAAVDRTHTELLEKQAQIRQSDVVGIKRTVNDNSVDQPVRPLGARYTDGLGAAARDREAALRHNMNLALEQIFRYVTEYRRVPGYRVRTIKITVIFGAATQSLEQVANSYSLGSRSAQVHSGQVRVAALAEIIEKYRGVDLETVAGHVELGTGKAGRRLDYADGTLDEYTSVQRTGSCARCGYRLVYDRYPVERYARSRIERTPASNETYAVRCAPVAQDFG